jgi:glycosyltransferase involved in cell wall biosynthesis
VTLTGSNGVPRVVFQYRSFGPYHVARLAHARQVFDQAGIDLVPMELFGASRVHEWGGAAEIDNAVRLGLEGRLDDSIRYRDVPAMLNALQRIRPDAVFINGWGTRDAMAVHAWCVGRRVARVLVSDSTLEDRARVGVVEHFKALLVGGCEAGFVAGHPQLRYLERLGVSGGRIFLGCDVIDNAHFAPARTARERTGRRVLTVARFEPEKNLVRSARAFVRFAAGRPEAEGWRWTLVGYGSLADSLREIAARSDGALVVDGFRGYEELPAVYAEADIYFQPSISETWGLVVNEAMASGLPVLVSTKCGCAEDLVSPDVGWLLDPHSEEGIVAGLDAAARDFGRWRHMGDAAARRIGDWNLDRFSSGALQAASLALSSRGR